MINRKLTELQLAVLAAVRDGEVEHYVNRKIPYNRRYWQNSQPVISYRSHGFDVTTQIKALRRRQLIKFSGRSIFAISETGRRELEETEF